mgnify:FL=1
MYWHIHHDVLAEFAVEPIEERIAFIKAKKPEAEIETRLRLMRPIQHKLSSPDFKEISEAARACRDARAATKEARQKRHTTQGGFDLYREAYELANLASSHYQGYKNALRHPEYPLYKELEALHKLECPNCPWDEDTIFPTKVSP